MGEDWDEITTKQEKYYGQGKGEFPQWSDDDNINKNGDAVLTQPRVFF